MPFSVSLWGDHVPGADPALDTPNRLNAYLIDTDKPVPAVIVFPGGAYAGRAPHEGEPIAEFYNSCGFQAFTVDYRVMPYTDPAPLMDAQRAIRVVRANAAAWGVDPERVFTCGFSAGGHLAGCTAILPDVAAVGDDLDAISAKPTGAILGYPVTSGLPEHGHARSIEILLGDRYEAEKEDYTLFLRVDEHTAPCFIWHTAEDKGVPCVHSLRLAEALAAHGVPCEMHLFPRGHHGVALANGQNGTPDLPDTARWAAWSAEWIRRF